MPWLLWPVGGRHHLRRPGGAGPNRHEAADRLFQRQPLGLLHAGPVRAEPAGRARGRAANDQSRAVDRRPVRRRGHDLRALSHARDQPSSAGWPGGLPCWRSFMLVFTLVQHRPAGTERFCRRVSDSDRHVPARPGPTRRPRWRCCISAIAVLAVLGVVLGAWYMLWLVQRVFFGPLKEADHSHSAPPVRDLSPHEIAALAPLVVFIVWIGLHPQFFLSRMQPTLEPLSRNAAQALHRTGPNEPALVGHPKLPVGELTRVE